LGGDDIDLEIATFMLGSWEYTTGKEITEYHKEIRKELYRKFIKISSQFKEEAEDYISNDLGLPEFAIIEDLHTFEATLPINFRRSLSLSQYESITGKFLQIKSDMNIYRPIEEALTVANNIDSSFSKDSLDIILYTGGSTKMMNVQRALKSFFAGKPCLSIDEEDACNTVALGAAACRYDEIFGGKNVSMTKRLLESIFTRLPGSTTYTTIVPLETETSKYFEKVDKEFMLQRPSIKLKLPLFRGVSIQDHQLSPMRDMEIPFSQIIDKMTPYEIHYRMTENKTFELKFRFNCDNGTIEVKTGVTIFDDSGHTRSSIPLCEVNSI
jgi:molecular chaperone DnaK (HSP70)